MPITRVGPREEIRPVLWNRLADAIDASAGVDTALRGRVDPLVNGSDQQFTVWDSSVGRVGWFNGPVLVSSWAPYKLDVTGVTPMAVKTQQFLDSLSGLGIPGVLLPGQYNMNAPVLPGNDTVLYAYGATLVNTNTSLLARPGAANESIVTLLGVDNVKIFGLETDGRKAFFAGVTEDRHGVLISGATNIVLEDVYNHDSKGDGVLVIGASYSGGVPALVPRNIHLNRVRNIGNYRQGMSVVCVDGLWASACDFNDTAGTSPQAGVDIEPSLVGELCRNVNFDACNFNGNAGAGLAIVRFGTPTAEQRGCRVTRSTMRANFHGIGLSGGEGLVADQCILEENVEDGLSLADGNGFTDLRFSRGHIRRNGKRGVALVPVDQTTVVRRIRIEDTDIRDNSQASPGTYSGIAIFRGTFSRIGFFRNTIEGISHANGILTDNFGGLTTINYFQVIDNNLSGNTAPSSYGVTATNAVYRDNLT